MHTFSFSSLFPLCSAMVSALVVSGTAIAETSSPISLRSQVSSKDLPAHYLKGETKGILKFTPPVMDAPSNRVGGGSRGTLQFKPPIMDAPSSRIGGGSRGTLQFKPPVMDAPSSRIGGGSRGTLQFKPPIVDAPTGRIGGGTRSLLEFEATDTALNTVSPATGNVRQLLEFTAPSDVQPTTVDAETRNLAYPPLTALLPELKIGRTVAARPTFYVYVPPTASQEVFFSIQTGDRQQHYQTKIPIDGKGGVIQFTLPENAPALAVDRDYQWFFALIEPNGILRPDNYGVNGWVKRVAAPSEVTADPLAQASQYAAAGIWYDTLAVLATNQSLDPQNQVWRSEWRDLLTQVGLTDIADAPITR